MKSEIKSIEEICLNVCSGGTPTSSEKKYYENGTIPWLTTGEVNFNRIYDTNTKITELGLKILGDEVKRLRELVTNGDKVLGGK